jgi:hypothetical protein
MPKDEVLKDSVFVSITCHKGPRSHGFGVATLDTRDLRLHHPSPRKSQPNGLISKDNYYFDKTSPQAFPLSDFLINFFPTGHSEGFFSESRNRILVVNSLCRDHELILQSVPLTLEVPILGTHSMYCHVLLSSASTPKFFRKHCTNLLLEDVACRSIRRPATCSKFRIHLLAMLASWSIEGVPLDPATSKLLRRFRALAESTRDLHDKQMQEGERRNKQLPGTPPEALKIFEEISEAKPRDEAELLARAEEYLEDASRYNRKGALKFA